MWKYFLCQTGTDSNQDVSPSSKTETQLRNRHSLAIAVKGVTKSTYEQPLPLSHVSSSSDTSQPNLSKVSVSSSKTRKFMESMGYILGKEIGKGTFAKVKIASSRKYEEPLACKIISKIDAPQEFLTKFLPREIEAASKLRHPNLIRFYQSIETTQRVYLIMEFAEKGSLYNMIKRDDYLQEHVARKYFDQLTSAIKYCHMQGFAHRDIKCENLLLDKDFNLKIIDFGFSCLFVDPRSKKFKLSQTYCGSWAYASPELLNGIPYSPHMADIWAIGVVLFTMVCGQLPFNNSNHKKLRELVQTEVQFPSTPQISAACKNILRKILAPLKDRVNLIQMRSEPWATFEHKIDRPTLERKPQLFSGLLEV